VAIVMLHPSATRDVEISSPIAAYRAEGCNLTMATR